VTTLDRRVSGSTCVLAGRTESCPSRLPWKGAVLSVAAAAPVTAALKRGAVVESPGRADPQPPRALSFP
jgi:hypothetical protein